MTPFDELGPERLRAITDELVSRISTDLMIGFHFKRLDLSRLRRLEYQHAAELLGGPVHYEGRPLGVAHAPHRIAGGHFSRRTEILRRLLLEHGVSERVATAWLTATEALRAEIVGGEPECH